MSKVDEALEELRKIADKITRKQWLELTDSIEYTRTALELGKLYKEYFEFFEKQFDTDNGYGVTVINIKKKIKELNGE